MSHYDDSSTPNPFSTSSDTEEDVPISAPSPYGGSNASLAGRSSTEPDAEDERSAGPPPPADTYPQSVNPYPSGYHSHSKQHDRAVSDAASAMSKATLTPPRKQGSSSSPIPTQRASFPSPSKGGMEGLAHYSSPAPLARTRDGNCCDRDRDLMGGAEIHIVDAVKMSDHGAKGPSYIAYVIRCGDHETRRRYSAFDSLRNALIALYPVLIVPPIPSKQSLTEYAVKGGQSKAKEDATVIARRIRMLEDFLRRVAKHPILSGEHVFHRFLEEGVSWQEVLMSPPVNLLPKNPLHAPSHNPTMQPLTAGDGGEEDGGAESHTIPFIAHHLLPTPSASTPLKNPDARFMDSESFTDRFSSHLSSQLEKVNRRVVKRWGERAHGFSELGALLNGFSLDAEGELQTAIEKIGQAVDAEQMSTALLLQGWEKNSTEPLHVYAQYGQIIRQRLAFRHQKHVQYELVQETLDAQREKLEVLERQEREARRLEEALESGGKGLVGSSGTGLIKDPAEMEAERVRERERIAAARAAGATGGAGTLGRKAGGGGGGGGYGLISAVKHSISGMMDVDPEATRRANIGRTRDNIAQLEDSLQASAQDLKYASTTLQADLDRFQRQKMVDLRDMCVAVASLHKEWAAQNLKAWERALEAIDAIPPHPNKMAEKQHQQQHEEGQ